MFNVEGGVRGICLEGSNGLLLIILVTSCIVGNEIVIGGGGGVGGDGVLIGGGGGDGVIIGGGGGGGTTGLVLGLSEIGTYLITSLPLSRPKFGLAFKYFLSFFF